MELAPGDPSDLTRIVLEPSDFEALLDRDPSAQASPLLEYLIRNLDQGRVEHWHKHLARLSQTMDVQAILASDAGYPVLLSACWDAPPVLFVRGRLPTTPGVAIIGSRETDDGTLREAGAVARAAVLAGFHVVSGLALGVDTAAHTAAIAAGGQTVAVMGTGVEQVYPQRNARLAEEITRTGALVSQFPPPAPRTGTTFLRRNSVIAGWARVSVVMDARDRSGSRHEAEQAINYGRSVLLWEENLRAEKWAIDLVRSRAATFVASPGQVTSALLANAGS